jgi:hypothetical protein
MSAAVDLDIEFDEAEHAYFLEGVRVPALTHVLQKMSCVPGFWFLTPDDLAFYQSRGKAVHRTVELVLKGNLDRRTLSREIRPYLTGIDKFLSDYSVEVLDYRGEPFVEQRLIHTAYRYGCTPDIVARIGKDSGVIEVKATSQHSPATSLQTAAQLIAVRQVVPSIGRMRMGLRLLQEAPWYDLRHYNERSDESVWLSMLNAYNFLWQHKLLK